MPILGNLKKRPTSGRGDRWARDLRARRIFTWQNDLDMVKFSRNLLEIQAFLLTERE
jgi:hypothetical protein